MKAEITTRGALAFGLTGNTVVTAVAAWLTAAANNFWATTIASIIFIGIGAFGAYVWLTRDRTYKILYTVQFNIPRVPVAERGTGFAAWIAGKRRNVGSAWLDDLRGDPENKDVPGKAKKALMVASFFWSALRYRVHDLARPFVRPVDWVLRTRDRREGFVGSVVGAHVIFIVWHFGFYTLVTYGWTWTGGSGVFAWAVLNWLGKRRGIELASDDDPAKKE